MKKNIVSLCVATLMAIAQGHAGVTLTVPDVNIAQGSTSYVIINYDLGTLPYTAYQMDIAYPDGISSVSDDDGNPAFLKGEAYAEGHNVSSIFTATGQSRFQCFSTNSVALTAQSGTLLILPIKAQKSLAEGTYQATISPIEFVQTDATPDRPAAVTFNIVVGKDVVLDENSTLPPAAATGVNVTVKKAMKADEWTTICLPFEMSEMQLTSAFGQDVKLCDFSGYETEENAAGDIVGIRVNFKTVTAMKANHPYIIKVPADMNEFSLDDVNLAPVDKPMVATVTRTRRQWSEMIGTYVAGTVLEENMLYLKGNKFWYSTGTAKLNAYSAYFDLYDVPTDAGNWSVKMIVDGAGTQVSSIIGDASDAEVYDLGGRKVADSTQRGIYIKGNKKVAVK